MPLKITSLLIDTMALATEAPEPLALPTAIGIPINPMLFPNDWSLEVTLETRWQTDVTRPANSNRPERWSLISRPGRTLTARVVGMGKDEAHALLQSALGFTEFFGSPVPIYPDASAITSIASNRLFGDFRFRRFFVGGRVAIYPLRINPAKNANSVIFATVLEASPDSILVNFHASTTRTPTTLDVVAPCMDVELLQSVSGVSQIDTLYELGLTWTEVEGACSLPASWPATNITNPEVLSPFCQVVDSLPVFPFNPDWTEGVTVEVLRDINSSGSGRSTLQDPQGRAYQRFSMNVMGYDRESAWKVVRFFDSMRGRAGSFYLVHPHRPWTFGAIPALDRVSIAPVGDATKIYSYFRKLAFFRADGTFITREISSVTDLTSAFNIILTANLPDFDFVDVQPVMVCSFDQDNLVEGWATNTIIPALRLTIREEPDVGTVSVGNIGYKSGDPAFLSIPGCNLLLHAGSGCKSSGYTQTDVWPGRGNPVNHWVDESFGPNRQNTKTPPFKTMDRVVSPGTCDLIRFPQQWQNNGQPAIKDPRFSLVHQLSGLPISDRHLWSLNEWTLLMCFTPEPHTAPPSGRSLMEIRTPEQDLIFRIDRAAGTGAGRAAFERTPAASVTQVYPFTVDISTAPYTVYVTLRVSAGIARCWVNGSQAWSGSSSFSLPLPSAYTTSDWFAAFNRGVATSSSYLMSLFGNWGCANLVVSYNRGIDIEEINLLHSIVAEMYRTTQSPSVLY